MRLSIIPIKNYIDNNHYQLADNWTVRQEANTLYFQVVDLDQSKIRYMSEAATVTLALTFPSFDDAQVITATATIVQPTKDKSIWKVVLSDTQIPKSGNVKFSLTEDGITKKWICLDILIVELLDEVGGC
jgi:hypothetical protein